MRMVFSAQRYFFIFCERGARCGNFLCFWFFCLRCFYVPRLGFTWTMKWSITDARLKHFKRCKWQLFSLWYDHGRGSDQARLLTSIVDSCIRHIYVFIYLDAPYASRIQDKGDGVRTICQQNWILNAKNENSFVGRNGFCELPRAHTSMLLAPTAASALGGYIISQRCRTLSSWIHIGERHTNVFFCAIFRHFELNSFEKCVNAVPCMDWFGWCKFIMPFISHSIESHIFFLLLSFRETVTVRSIACDAINV